MQHLQPYHLYEHSHRQLVSPSMSPITHYFETSQGSKYLLSETGETKRWKSSHSNTGGEDMGLKPWYSHSMFVPEGDQHVMLAYEHLADRGYPIAISQTGTKRTWIIYKDREWIPATYAEAYPNWSKLHPEQAQQALVFTSQSLPQPGLMAVEYRQEANGLIRSFHPGSLVSKVLPIEQTAPSDLAHFGIQSIT